MYLAASVKKDDTTGETSEITITMGDERKPYIIEKTHPHINKIESILEKITAGEASKEEGVEELTELLDQESSIDTVKDDMRKLSNKISTDGESLFYGDESLEGAVEDYVIKTLKNGGNYKPIVSFIERVYDNQSKYVRDQLFSWIERNAKEGNTPMTLTKDGMIVGYKGCAYIEGEGVTPYSLHSGTAYVQLLNETEVRKIEGRIPYPIGAIVTMPKREVNDDPNAGCSTGLHVGTWDYAKEYARDGVLLTVEVDPADVVSVPADSLHKKLRCCKLRVVGATELRLDDLVFDFGSDIDDHVDDDEDNSYYGIDDCVDDDDDNRYCRICEDVHDEGDEY